MNELFVPEPNRHYTSKQMLIEARKRGYTDVIPRTLRQYVEHGLLDQPERRWPGAGGGSSTGRWSHYQLRLWLALLDQRKKLVQRYGRQVHATAELCNVPIYVWLYWGDQWGVPLRQVRRAMRTWAAARSVIRSYERLQRDVAGFIRLSAHPQTREKRRVTEALTHLIASGEVPPEDQLRYLLGMVMDPHGRGERKGPAEAPLSADSLTDLIRMRAAALKQLATSARAYPNDGLWEWARYTLLRTRGWYQEAQPRLAADPATLARPELQRLYHPADVEHDMNSACLDLLAMLGSAELARQATHAPPDMQPANWEAGLFTGVVESHLTPSLIVLPDGRRQAYAQIGFRLSRREPE